MGKKKIKDAPKGKLKDQIEIIREPSLTDSLDSEHGSYVESFLNECNNILPLEQIDLLTPEGAKEALKYLAERQKEIEALSKNLRAIKKL